MISKVKLPKFDANMEEAAMGAWLKRAGDAVAKKEPLVEMVTDKAAFEFESPAAGILRKILAPEKSVVPVGYVLALIGGADDKLPDVEQYNRALLEKRRQEAEGGAIPKSMPKPSAAKDAAGGKVRATPAARRLAREKGLDLAAVQQTLNVDVVDEESVLKFLKR
jgi:pyruvate/2-oxoglutarate dehydrogenase complex dihydrolipoamide acyltransferase (E2) component